MYGIEALHAVRIAAKKLRYALELAGASRVAGVARALGALRAAQDLLGELHDRHVLAQFAGDAAGQGPSGVAARERQLVGLLEAECLVIHAEYLQHRDRLLAVADDAVTRVAPAVIGRPPSRRPARRLARAG
jgi:CHAD domain-containing protein